MKKKLMIWLTSLLAACVLAGGVCYFFADSIAGALGLTRMEAAAKPGTMPNSGVPMALAPVTGNKPGNKGSNSGAGSSGNTSGSNGTGSNSNTGSTNTTNSNSGTTSAFNSSTNNNAPTDNASLQPITPENDALRQAVEARDAYKKSLQNVPGKQIASFSTSLAGHSASGRVMNIELAAKKLNGTILMPGDLFSFNGITGDSNQPSAGWQLATVIVGHSFEQGYGGGICQVSSTLYNSVLESGLQVVERYSHSLPVGYVPPGHDATVSYPELDFKFRNTLHYPVRVGVTVADGLVYATIYQLPAQPTAN